MFIRLIAFLLSSFVAFSSQGESRKILSCESQHSPFDPGYVQGSEVFGEVYFDETSKSASLVMESFEKPRATLYEHKNSEKVSFSEDQSSGFLQWTKDYASLVFLGSKWGFVIDVSDDHPNKDWAGLEIEMMCEETTEFEKVLN